jgi:hypothetical protein
MLFNKNGKNQKATVAYTYNFIYLGEGDWEDHSLRPAGQKSKQDHISVNKPVVMSCICHPAAGRGHR